MPLTRWLRAVVGTALVAASVSTLAACTSSGGSSSVSVFDVKPGECFTAPSKVKAELSDLTKVACTKPHTQELYAQVDYVASGSSGSSGTPAPGTAPAGGGAYPGAEVLDKYAKGVCAQQFTKYVGIDYLRSKLFYTYLLPSARSWEQGDDRSILCFVTTTGGKLTSSVKGSRR